MFYAEYLTSMDPVDFSASLYLPYSQNEFKINNEKFKVLDILQNAPYFERKEIDFYLIKNKARKTPREVFAIIPFINFISIIQHGKNLLYQNFYDFQSNNINIDLSKLEGWQEEIINVIKAQKYWSHKTKEEICRDSFFRFISLFSKTNESIDRIMSKNKYNYKELFISLELRSIDTYVEFSIEKIVRENIEAILENKIFIFEFKQGTNALVKYGSKITGRLVFTQEKIYDIYQNLALNNESFGVIQINYRNEIIEVESNDIDFLDLNEN